MIMQNIKSILQPNKMVNFILILICIAGFSYQVYLILEQYMLANTVVNIEVKRLTAQSLPAITICNPSYLSMSKLSEFNKIDQGSYQAYSTFTSMLSNSSIRVNDTTIKTIKGYLARAYGTIKNSYQDKILNLHQLFDLGSTDASIRINFFGKTEFKINESFVIKFKLKIQMDFELEHR
jgi:hypothetical protein